MSILFCTSFNQELYKASGHSLLNSFEKYQKIGDLFIGYEGWQNSQTAISLPYVCNLNEDVFLQTWLEENKAFIPEYLGGLTKPCNCSPTPFKRKPEKHKRGCHFNWFNRNASRWFRKVATIHAALKYIKEDKSKYKYLIWIDADCEFKKELNIKRLEKIFADIYSLFYMRGPRAIPECGVFGFDLNQKGSHNFLKEYFDYYQTQRYIKYERWDDSYIFYKVIKEKGNLLKCLCRDIVPKDSPIKNPDVLQFSLLKANLIHNKGRHGRKLNIMK